MGGWEACLPKEAALDIALHDGLAYDSKKSVEESRAGAG